MNFTPLQNSQVELEEMKSGILILLRNAFP